VIENPYFHRGAIRQPEYFYGRVRETKRALQLLRNGQSVSIVGPRKIGKTSLLLHLMDPQVLTEYGMQADRYLFAYINGETCGSIKKKEIYRVMLEEASNCLPDGGTSLDLDPVLSTDLQFRQFGRAIRKLTQGGRKLVILIDEFEGLGRNRQLEEDFFSSLRSLTLHDVAFVTASQDPLLDLTLQEDVLSSPFFNIFALLRLGTFSRQEAMRFIEWSFHHAGVSLTRQMVTSILEFVGTHPFCLQVACYHAFELATDGKDLDKENYERLHEDILRDLQDHFAYSLDRLDEDQKRALARLAQMGESEIPLDVAQDLWRRCLVVRGDHGYRCQSCALDRYVRLGLAPSWEAAVAEGERRLATILFVDLVDFTGMADKRKPEDIMHVVKQVTKLFSDPVERHGGRVIQFRGDGILALFGVPVERQDDAARAVRAGLDMQQNLETIGPEIAAQYGVGLSARIGLNTGVVVVGEMGNPQHSVHTAMGDAVNMAERMQRTADPGDIVMSESTYQQVRGLFRVRSLGAILVKGKLEPVRAYCVLGER
jgi:class 3 adenylate cyclase